MCSQGEQPLNFVDVNEFLSSFLPSFPIHHRALSFSILCSHFGQLDPFFAKSLELAALVIYPFLTQLALSNSKGVFEEKWLAQISIIQRYFCQQYERDIEEASKTTQYFTSSGLTVTNFALLSMMLQVTHDPVSTSGYQPHPILYIPVPYSMAILLYIYL